MKTVCYTVSIEVNAGRLSESSVISLVSAVEGCPLNGGSTVVLLIQCFMIN